MLIDVIAYTNALKYIWDDLQYLWMYESPFAAIIPHKSDLTALGKYLPVAVSGLRAGNSFADVATLKNAPTLRRFLLQRRKLYCLGSIDEEAMFASANDASASVDVMTMAIKAAEAGFGRRLAKQIWGNGGGALAQVAAASAFVTTTCTLLNADDAVGFEYDMEVQCSSDDGIAGAGVRAGSATVTGLSLGTATSTLTSDANWNAQITAPANSDYLFAYGDYGLGIQGVTGWCPPTAPAPGDNWMGVDRSIAPHLLAGQRYNASGGLIEEAVFDAVGYGGRIGARFDLLVLSPTAAATLRKSAYSKAWFPVSLKSSVGDIGFDTIGFAGPQGMKIAMLEEPFIPAGRFLLTKKDTWQLAHAGPLPHFAEVAGQKFWPSVSDDAKDFRLKAYLNLGNSDPRHSLLGTL